MKLQHILWGLFFLNPTLSSAKVMSTEVAESEITFSYASTDGEFNLKCTHYLHDPALHDFDVWCGKGTRHMRTFRVHFLSRQHERADGGSALEVLYWVIDRDTTPRKFSSGSTWINFRSASDLERLTFSQGVENDYANLSVEYRPR